MVFIENLCENSFNTMINDGILVSITNYSRTYKMGFYVIPKNKNILKSTPFFKINPNRAGLLDVA